MLAKQEEFEKRQKIFLSDELAKKFLGTLKDKHGISWTPDKATETIDKATRLYVKLLKEEWELS